ncbi:hypothetical protein [Sabulibacter ruber]|uniref:hypothetical protein n=1 Tax=Sabulibacter ruber TaxID=2811901 RepID=UPI001A95C59B|nr:hypothetical protein [Sabulibacter ruber]
MKLTKLFSLFFACSLLVFSSCTDDEETGPITGNKTCKPVKVTDEDGVTAITYNNDKISSFSNEEFGTVAVSYHSSGNKAGKLSKLTFSAGEEGDGSLEYVYDEQGKLIGTVFASESEEFMGAAMVSEFEYTGNRISKTTRALAFPSEEEGGEPMVVPFGHTTYEYDSKGNVTRVREYMDNPMTEEDESNEVKATVEYTYDSKTSTMAILEAMFIGMPGINPAGVNNVLTAVHKDGATVNKNLSYSNAYVFNENGYATKTTQTTQNGAVTVTNIEYSCN